MTEVQLDAELERLLDSKPEGFEGCERFKMWSEVLDFSKTSFYVGSTWRTIRLEAAAFLTRRTNKIGGTTRVHTPTITHPNGKRLTIRKAEEFGFMFVPFFKNVSMYNCMRLEWKLDTRRYTSIVVCYGSWQELRRRLWQLYGLHFPLV